MTVGGIPLIYLGDEVGTLNDYTYRDDPARALDSRWVHRPKTDWDVYAKRSKTKTVAGRVYQNIQSLIALRKQKPVFSAGELEIILTGNAHVLAYTRQSGQQRAVIFANFSESQQSIPGRVLEQYHCRAKTRLYGLSEWPPGRDLILAPMDFLVLA